MTRARWIGTPTTSKLRSRRRRRSSATWPRTSAVSPTNWAGRTRSCRRCAADRGDDTVSFRHLGPRVEQILAEAHAEADAIRQAATESAAWLREATDAHVRAVVAEHARTVADYDERERWMREEEERLTERLRTRQDAVARAEQYRDQLRSDAEQLLAAAQEQHERLIASVWRTRSRPWRGARAGPGDPDARRARSRRPARRHRTDGRRANADPRRLAGHHRSAPMASAERLAGSRRPLLGADAFAERQ